MRTGLRLPDRKPWRKIMDAAFVDDPDSPLHGSTHEPEQSKSNQAKDSRSSESTADFRLTFQTLLYDWVRSEIPQWKPDRDKKYQRASQAIVVPIPESASGPPGMVYFKSIADPFWTAEDVSALEASHHSWILLVLSPFERYYEFEEILDAIVSKSSKFLVWHPGSPDAAQIRVLQESSSGQRPERVLEARAHGIRAENILRALYLERGVLITRAGRHKLHDGDEKKSLSGQLSALLLQHTASTSRREANPRVLQTPRSASEESKDRALRWVSLLTESSSVYRNIQAAEQHLAAWWTGSYEAECAALSAKLHAQPEMFKTIALSQEMRNFEGTLALIRPALERLWRREVSFLEAMDRIEHLFSSDERNLLNWRRSAQNLRALILWSPVLQEAREYLVCAFPLGCKEPDQIRQELLAALNKPHLLLKPLERENFDRKFRNFKSCYADAYNKAHENALRPLGGKKGSRVDRSGLQNLEMLANLRYADKSYLYSVRAIVEWVRRNQCDFPVRQILERYPRCYCNFNPVRIIQPRDSAAQINATITTGIAYVRGFLSHCRNQILAELEAQKVDNQTRTQIAALLNDSPLTALRPNTIDFLNRSIEKHPKQFRAAFRECQKNRQGDGKDEHAPIPPADTGRPSAQQENRPG